MIFDCLKFETTPTWITRTSYLYTVGTGWPIYTFGQTFLIESQIQIQSENYIMTDGQSASRRILVSDTHVGPATNCSSFFIMFRQLRVSWCGTPSLTRSRVCSLQLLLALASGVFLGSESGESHNHIPIVSDLRLPQPGGSDSYIQFPHE
jgi:hypothetical protein